MHTPNPGIMRRPGILPVLLLLSACGDDGNGDSASSLIAHVHLMTPLDPEAVDGFDLVVSKDGGFAGFADQTFEGEMGTFVLRSEDTDQDKTNEAVLSWPEGATFPAEFPGQLRFKAAEAFEVDLRGSAMDGKGRVIATGQATAMVPESGAEEVDLYIECLTPDCTAQRDLGEDCLDAAFCLSGSCADGVCCESACDGPLCESCGADGLCTAAASGTDPDDDCGDCRVCNGARACVNVPDDTDPWDECDAEVGCGTECQGGACDFALVTTDCGPCQECDGAGMCEFVAPGLESDTDCGTCSVCDGSGDCMFVTSGDPAGECTRTGTPPCNGQCNAGTCDWSGVVGMACGAPMCLANAIQILECDALGACGADQTPEDCGPYLCVAPTCPVTCQTNADCFGGAVCDTRDIATVCAEAITGVCVPATHVDCDSGGDLQSAIDNCMTSPCTFTIQGTCNAITVSDKSVYIDGSDWTGTINAAGPTSPVVANESVADVRVTLVGTTVTGGTGTASGISAVSTGASAVEVCLLGGTRVEANGGAGVDVDTATLVVEESLIQQNDESGIRATDSTVEIRRSMIASNLVDGQPGVFLSESTFAIENSFIVRNGGLGVLVTANLTAINTAFRHNTVADNLTGGMDCQGGFGATEVVRSLFWNGGATGAELMNGCTRSNSDIPDSDVADAQDVCGDGDTMAPPFVSVMPPIDYHLMTPGTYCRGAISCDPMVTDDFDGDDRPIPVGGMCEPGADEAP